MADKSDTELLQSISGQVAELVRREIDQAKKEVRERAKSAGAGGALLGSAGVLALYGGGAGVAAIVLSLGRRMPPWLAAALTGATLTGAAGVLARQGAEKIRKASPSPAEALHGIDQTLKSSTGGADDR